MAAADSVLSRVGLVVHPTRAPEWPLRELREWAARNDVELVQVAAFAHQRQRVADEGDPAACDLLVSIGGDGTTLAAIRIGVGAAVPVLSAAFGSLGILTSVPVAEIVDAVERFSRGEWAPRSLPALETATKAGAPLFALNDIAVVRAGAGQLRLMVEVDGEVLARVAGDGCIVSTAIGSSAYALSARGPLLAPDLDAFAVTPLPAHGGSCPPLVLSAGSTLRIGALAGHVGARLELDGQDAGVLVEPLTITLRGAVATVVTFADQPRFLAVLRERRIITDSPRILAEESGG